MRLEFHNLILNFKFFARNVTAVPMLTFLIFLYLTKVIPFSLLQVVLPSAPLLPSPKALLSRSCRSHLPLPHRPPLSRLKGSTKKLRDWMKTSKRRSRSPGILPRLPPPSVPASLPATTSPQSLSSEDLLLLARMSGLPGQAEN